MAGIPFSIEPATESDAKALAVLELKVFSAADGIITRRQFIYHIRSENLLFVARSSVRSEICLGYILVLMRKKSARLYSMATSPEFQKTGVARALIAHLLEKIKSIDIEKITLEVRKSNYKARKLYRTFGFNEAGVINHYYGDNEDAIAMVLNKSLCHSGQITVSSNIASMLSK